MTFLVTVDKRPNTFGLDERVWVLSDGQDSSIEVAPALGFNAYRWHVPQGELLYADPRYFEENKPTRSGFPILFPFPNRIRAGRFVWAGTEYNLPTNDPSGRNAIHGFACRKPWRVIGAGNDDRGAWVTGEFLGSRDAPESLKLWPADYCLQVTYRLEENRLQIDARVTNPDKRDLPFGLGYHPYFALALMGGADARVTVAANKNWELAESLPTGRLLPVDSQRDLRTGRRYADLQLDDVYTDIAAPKQNEPDSYGHDCGRGARPGNARLRWFSRDRGIHAAPPPGHLP